MVVAVMILVITGILIAGVVDANRGSSRSITFKKQPKAIKAGPTSVVRPVHMLEHDVYTDETIEKMRVLGTLGHPKDCPGCKR